MSERLPDYVEIVVIDNCSDDGTFEALSKLSKHNVKIRSNANNIGLVGSFLRFFDEVESPYLMVVSDEDEVLCDRLEAYVNFLVETNPCAAVAKKVVNRVVFDDRELSAWGKTKKILPEDFMLFNVISSVTFNVNEAKKHRVEIKTLARHNEYVMLYPHVALAMRLFARGCKVYSYGVILVVKRYMLDTSIKAGCGGKFFYVEPRWRQFKGLYSYCGYLEETEGADSVVIEKMRSAGCSRILEFWEKGIALELPGMHPYFVAAMNSRHKHQRFRFMRFVRRSARYVIVNLLRLRAVF